MNHLNTGAPGGRAGTIVTPCAAGTWMCSVQKAAGIFLVANCGGEGCDFMVC